MNARILHTLTIAAASTFIFMGGFCDPDEPDCYWDSDYYCDLSATDCFWDGFAEIETAWFPDGAGGEYHDCVRTPGYGNCDRAFYNCGQISNGSWQCWYWSDAIGDYATEYFAHADAIDPYYLDFECRGGGDWTCSAVTYVQGGWVDCAYGWVCEGAEICR